MATRNVWARGLTPNEVGRKITLADGSTAMLREVHHTGTERTYLTLLHTIEVSPTDEVIVHE